jgi:type II restriction enzyme
MEIQLTGNKSDEVKRLIFAMLDILGEVGIPLDGTPRRLEKMAMACLAVGDIKTVFAEAKSANDNHFLTTREIITFENENYCENISSGSYDDIRRKDLLFPIQAKIVLNSSSFDVQATNNPTRGYALNPMFAELIKCYGTAKWKKSLANYKKQVEFLKEELERKRNLEKIPVKLPSGIELELSAGEHNVLQKCIVEDFLARFGMGAEVLYIGDTSDKFLFKNHEVLNQIGFFTLEHEELPDVVAYCHEKNLLFLIEAVHSAGPMSEIRVRKLKKQLEKCTAYPIFVTTFLNKKEFRKWVTEIAWETEVWIADNPEHMIHFNGYKFLEIHQ